MYDSRVVNKLLERDTVLRKSLNGFLNLPIVLLYHLAKITAQAQVKVDRAALKLEHKPSRVSSGKSSALAKMDGELLIHGCSKFLILHRGGCRGCVRVR